MAVGAVAVVIPGAVAQAVVAPVVVVLAEVAPAPADCLQRCCFRIRQNQKNTLRAVTPIDTKHMLKLFFFALRFP